MSSEIRKATGEADWFTHSRFGMFIHWGLYALPARHEWVKNQERIPDEDYQKYFDYFEPDLYDPVVWARAAKAAGMKYFVITTKHHEGFCLWDTQQTDYKVTNTPYGKDLLKPMVEAFRAEGLRIGFYYSLLDWHHPDFPVDRFHPMRDSQQHRAENKSKDIRNYAAYMQAQLRELMTEFGQIDHLFLDFSYPGEDGKGRDDWQSEALVKMIRELQPNILINDRADLMETDWGWDFKTPEQFMVREWVKVGGQRVLWETCQTFSGSWGYHRDESTWKSVEQLVQMLIETVSKGGNLLLNVGPTARGEFDERAMERLSGIGKWLRNHGRSIYGCTEAPAAFKAPPDCRLTYNPETQRLYAHLFAWPFMELHLDGFAGKVKYAQFLHDGSEVRLAEREAYQAAVDSISTNTLTLRLPVQKPNTTVPVIELFLNKR
jgi:alpha-L-fucosidase